MIEMPLGKEVVQPRGHDPSVLYPIPRTPRDIEIHGYDLWRAYELIWLNSRGKPETGILEIVYPSRSGFMVESKSLKLYLGGLSYSRFDARKDLEETIRTDLEHILRTDWISVGILEQGRFSQASWKPHPEGTCLDGIDVSIDAYQRDPGLLACSKVTTSEALFSDLLRTNCPITGQPDWASVLVRYQGRAIRQESLLKYLCSYRDHEGFSEDVCEQIFSDITERCRPEMLSVRCFYTRRGGIDINPMRCSHPVMVDEIDRSRLIRQ